MARVVSIVGHPRKGTYCEALAAAYAKGARAGGHKVDLYRTSDLSFDPVLHEGFENIQRLERDLLMVHDAILNADHLVFTFPLWMGMMPVELHGLLERIFQADLLPRAKQGEFPALLKGKSITIVITMGMPALAYRFWFGGNISKILKQSILGLLGASPIRFVYIGSMGRIGDMERRRWIDKLEKRGKRVH